MARRGAAERDEPALPPAPRAQEHAAQAADRGAKALASRSSTGGPTRTEHRAAPPTQPCDPDTRSTEVLDRADSVRRHAARSGNARESDRGDSVAPPLHAGSFH